MKLLLALLLLLPAFAFANESAKITTDHAKVTIASEVKIVAANKPFWVLVHFALKDDWHIYWKNPGDSGLSPTLNWTLPQGFAAEAIHWPAPKRIVYDTIVDYGYDGEATLLVPIMPPKDLPANEPIEIKVKAGWLICNQVCIPERGEVALTLTSGERVEPNAESALTVANTLQELPMLLPAQGKLSAAEKNVKLSMELPQDWKKFVLGDVYFYPDDAGVVKHEENQKWVLNEGKLQTEIPQVAEVAPEELAGLWELVADNGEMRYYRVEFSHHPKTGALIENPQIKATLEETGANAAPTKAPISGWQAVLFALLGGMLLNAMPCVFPVLSLKALAISKKAQAGSSAAIRKQGLAYLAGTVSSFMVLAGILILLKQSGDAVGWGFQLQSPAFVAGMVYLFLLLGLSLVGMFELPQMLGGLGNDKASKDNLSGSFFTGILAVLVATPCTVPFMAPALGYAFTQSAGVTLAVMAAMGLGLAIPYLAVCFYPAIQHRLPKPGVWMVRFKEFMAFPIFATAAWLVWVLAQQISLTGLAAVLAMVVTLPFLIWLGRNKPRGFQWAVAAVALLLAVYSFSALQPTASTQMMVQESGHESVAYDEKLLADLRAAKKPVFLDATAAWCITCKVNERVALSSKTLHAEFKKRGITFMVADWTNYDEKITRLLEQFDHQGVPLYVYFPPEGEPVVLPQLLTETIVLNAINGEK